MRKKFINGLLLAVLTFAATNVFVSCKDTSADYITELQGQYNDVTAYNTKLETLLTSQIEALEKAKNDLQKQYDELAGKEANDRKDIDALKKDVESLQGQIDALNKELAALKGSTSCDCKDKIAELEKKIAELKDELASKTELQKEIADRKAQDALLEEAINALKKQLAGKADATDVVKQISEANTAAATAAALAQQALEVAKTKADAAQVTALKGTVDALETAVNGWNNELKKVAADAASALAMATANAAKAEVLSNDLDKVKAELAAAKATYDNAIKVINEALASVQKQISELGNTVADLQTAYDAAIAKLQSDVKAVEGEIAAIKTAVAATDQALDALQAEFDALKENTKITGVVLQGAYNPVVGYAALPFGFKTNILATYYGENQMPNAKYVFPTKNIDYYVYSEDAFTDEALKVIGGKFNGAESEETEYVMDGNAGTLYFTINPAGADYTSCTATLVNSLDEESGIVLGAIKPSTKKLSFGYTRSIENGFYEADATLDPSKIDVVKPNIDKNALKDVAKEILNKAMSLAGKGESSAINLTNIFETVQAQLDDVLDANAIKLAWGDNKVYSEYGIAATAVQPLSFGTLKDGAPVSLPKISEIGEISIELDMALSYAEEDIPDFSTKKYYIEGLGYVTIPEIQTVVNEMYTNLQSDVNELVDQINKQIDDNVDNINDMINDDYLGKVNSLIAKVNKVINKVNGQLKNINHYFQPCLVYANNKGEYNQMSNSLGLPTTFKFGAGNAIVLNPTTYTAEMFAPAFKKYIAVTNVYTPDKKASAQSGDATCQALADYANNTENLFNTVISGKNLEVVFAPKAGFEGYTYEITYAAVDYNGYNVARKFYVTVK